MEIVVTGHGMDVGQTLTSRIECEFVEKVGRYFENAIEGQATLKRQQRHFFASLRAHIARGTTIESSGSAVDAHSAFDAALERMAKQLRRYKRKLVSTNHHSPSSVLSPAINFAGSEQGNREKESFEAGNEPVIVAETTMAIPELTVSMAVNRINISGRANLFFRNAANGQLNAVYRREDGNIGWVDPSMQE
jgi:ribosomal subunit interface protein